ncbi:molybdopterin binding oxidoreductase [Xylariomycetidae sp. FL0641]|nr:molybdopterin binding oxidoreductase [Xylariomycetidae sp. FL0641]
MGADENTHADKPLNREPEVRQLVKSFITEDGYDRNHSLHPTPEQVDPSKHTIRVDGCVKNVLCLTIDNLKNDFEQHDLVCALTCAGNRRHEMRTVVKEVDGINWFDAAVMNCRWRGPLLRDVLARAEIDLGTTEDIATAEGEAHVEFASYKVECQDDTWYGASIPLSRALDPSREVVLALERNGRPLSIRHGAPVRVVVPGITGARAVKWLEKVAVQKGESDCHYMQRDYKVLPPEVTDAETAEKFWHRVPPVQEMPVNSVVAHPRSGETVRRDAQGEVQCHGYALPSGDGGPVVKVEVSGDGGRSWREAGFEHHEAEGRWTWRLWKASLPMPPGPGQRILSNATDAAGNTQPQEPPWNLRGVCYNAYGEAKDLTVV